MDNNNKYIAEQLIDWYEVNKRDLPWRNTDNPYFIWLSEIILQQTRVNQGLDYYLKFIDTFPTISDLANATEYDVLKNWQGLGYYSRARNLHKAAKQIVNNFNGKFPQNYNDILNLPGVGKYTAAAISSIAYNLSYPVIDGNVYRVLSRLFAVETPIDASIAWKVFSKIATDLIHDTNPGNFNQAIMEFGANYCVPLSPKCSNCMFKYICLAYTSDKVNKFPVRGKKNIVKTRYFNYLHIKFKDEIFISQRVKNDIWKNLYEFPLIETDNESDLNHLAEIEYFKNLFINISEVKIKSLSHKFKHILTHQIINAQFIEIEINELNTNLNTYIKIKSVDFNNFPISRLTEKYWQLTEKKLLP